MRFLELNSLSDKLAAVPSKPKKRKRTAKSESHLKVEQDRFAAFAAKVHVSFCRKVIQYFFDISLYTKRLRFLVFALTRSVART